jgi:hypothetical protein
VGDSVAARGFAATTCAVAVGCAVSQVLRSCFVSGCGCLVGRLLRGCCYCCDSVGCRRGDCTEAGAGLPATVKLAAFACGFGCRALVVEVATAGWRAWGNVEVIGRALISAECS